MRRMRPRLVWARLAVRALQRGAAPQGEAAPQRLVAYSDSDPEGEP